jgi:glycosyltransferase involved in cell wall biosynthesis
VSPRVSVVIPAYNASSTLSETLTSVLDQTFQDFEVIVIDDGSSDGTSEIADECGDPVRCFRTTNGGVSNARNRGIAESHGEYVALLDADDTWVPTKLQRQVEVLDSDAQAGGSYVGVIKVDDGRRELARLPAQSFDDLCRSLLLYSSVIPTSPSSLVLRRDVLDRTGPFDPRFSQCADWDYLLRLSRLTRLKPIDEYLALYRVGRSNMSRNIELLESDTMAVLDRFFSESDSKEYAALHDEAYSNHWMILSGSYLHDRNLASAFRCLGHGLRLRPANAVRPLGLPVRWLRRSVEQARTSKLPSASSR